MKLFPAIDWWTFGREFEALSVYLATFD